MLEPIGKGLEKFEQFRTHPNMAPEHGGALGKRCRLGHRSTDQRSYQHPEQALLGFRELLRVRRPLRLQKTLINLQATPIINMEQPPARAPQRFLIRTTHSLGKTRILTEIRPALTAAIDILQLEARFLKVSSQGATRSLSRQLSQRVHAFGPPRRHGRADIFEHDLGGYAIKLHVAACRQEWKARLDLLCQRLTRSTQQRLEASVEAKLAALVSDEIEYRADRLSNAAS